MSGAGDRRGLSSVDASQVLRNVDIEILGAAVVYGILDEGGATDLQDVRILLSGSEGRGVRQINGTDSRISRARITLEGGFTNAYGVSARYGTALRLERSTIAVLPSGTGLGLGVLLDEAADSSLSQVVASVSDYNFNAAVYSLESSFTADRLDLQSTGGADAYGVFTGNNSGSWEAEIRDSTIESDDATLRAQSDFSVRVHSSKLAGDDVVANGGTVSCPGTWDENYTFPMTAACP